MSEELTGEKEIPDADQAKAADPGPVGATASQTFTSPSPQTVTKVATPDVVKTDDDEKPPTTQWTETEFEKAYEAAPKCDHGFVDAVRKHDEALAAEKTTEV